MFERESKSPAWAGEVGEAIRVRTCSPPPFREEWLNRSTAGDLAYQLLAVSIQRLAQRLMATCYLLFAKLQLRDSAGFAPDFAAS